MNISSVCTDLQCTRAGLARQLGVSRALISIYEKRGYIPLARQYQIRDLLEGRQPLLDNRTQQKSPN